MADYDCDFNDLMLEATAEVQEIIRELIMELQYPRAKAEIGQAWASTPDDMKDQFVSERPEEYAELVSTLERSRPNA